MQSIDAVSLDMETQLLPPADWAQAKGRKALEKVVLRSHLTLYVQVCYRLALQIIAEMLNVSGLSQDGLWVRMKEADPVNSI